jgi:hypothetical protein
MARHAFDFVMRFLISDRSVPRRGELGVRDELVSDLGRRDRAEHALERQPQCQQPPIGSRWRIEFHRDWQAAGCHANGQNQAGETRAAPESNVAADGRKEFDLSSANRDRAGVTLREGGHQRRWKGEGLQPPNLRCCHRVFD